MADIEYHLLDWAIVFSVGLPILGIVAWKGWRSARTSFRWRLVLCFLLACLLTPLVLTEEDGGYVTWIIFPAVELAVAPLMAAFTGDLLGLVGMFFGLIPVLLATGVLLLIWRTILMMRENRSVRTTEVLPHAP